MSTSKPVLVVKPRERTESDLVDEIFCELKTSLTEGLSVALETEMKKAYDDQWLAIVLVKPPWTFRDVLRCFEKHWIAVFGMYLTRADQSYFNELHNHFKNTLDFNIEIDTVRGLVYNAQQLCTALLQHDKSNTALHQCANTLSLLIEKCNNNNSKETHSSARSANVNNTSVNKPNSWQSSQTLDRSHGEGKQTVAVATTSSCSGSLAIRDAAPSTSTHAEDCRLPKLGGIHGDGDIEMVLDQCHVPLPTDDSTHCVLQVFQSVGETVFNKSASILSALQHGNHQLMPLTDRHMVARNLVLLCSLLLTVVTAMARLLQGTGSEDAHQGMCDALDLFTRECEISPAGSGLHPVTFQCFMSVQSNVQTLVYGLRQFAEKLQELHEHLHNLDLDLYTRCRETLMVLASRMLS